jgi:hypothetical protein
MKGYRPYLGRSRKEIKELILAKQAKIKREELPQGWTVLAAEFINALLQRKPSKRLGYKNIEEMKVHPWMADIDWDLLAQKKLKSPFLPYINKENFDKEYCEGDEKIGDQTLERYEEYTQSECFEGLFENYTYMDLGKVDNYQKKYGKIKDETKINNKIYNKTNYNVNSNLLKDENFKTISLNKDTKNSLSNKSFHSHHNSPKIANIKIITNYINNSKKNKFKIKDLIEKDNHKEFLNPNYNSNEGIKVLSQNNSKKKIAAKETAFDLLKNKEQFKNIILKSILGNNNKEKKIKKEREDKISLSKIQKILMKNGRKINFNLTKKIFLNKSNSVKLVKPTNPNDLIHYNNYISNKKDEQTSGSPLTKNLMDLKNINKNGDFKTALLQQYLKNKNINSNKLNILLNKDRLNNKNQPLKRKKHRNNSQIEGEDFSKKVMTLLNNKEKTKDKNNKKEELKRYKNLFLNPNTNLYNIMTLNKNKSKNFHKNINSPTTNGDNSKHFSSTNNINNNIKRKTNKDNETIINQFYHPKLTINNRLKKNKIYNYLSNLNIHGKNNMQIYKKFPFVYNLNTISNSPKNMLTINLDDSYTKNIIKGKVINIHNHNFLTSNNIRSQKNIRNIIVNNISPTVNVLIHSEARKSLKNKKSKGQKRVNSNNNKSKTNKNNDNYNTDNESKIKYRRKQFNDSKKKYQKKDSLN